MCGKTNLHTICMTSVSLLHPNGELFYILHGIYNDNDNDNDKLFIFRRVCPYNIKKIHTMYNCKNSHGAPRKTIHILYNHNLSSLFQYLCITLVIKKLYEFEINTLDDIVTLDDVLMHFKRLNTNFLPKGGKFKI